MINGSSVRALRAWLMSGVTGAREDGDEVVIETAKGTVRAAVCTIFFEESSVAETRKIERAPADPSNAPPVSDAGYSC